MHRDDFVSSEILTEEKTRAWGEDCNIQSMRHTAFPVGVVTHQLHLFQIALAREGHVSRILGQDMKTSSSQHSERSE